MNPPWTPSALVATRVALAFYPLGERRPTAAAPPSAVGEFQVLGKSVIIRCACVALGDRVEVLVELAAKRLVGDPTDFLASLIPLREARDLTDDEIQKIKRFAV